MAALSRSSLTHLDISSTKLTSLPESIDNLTALTTLDISDCTGLTSLPQSIGNLTVLRHLNLRAAYSLTSLPESIGELAFLTTIYLHSCYSLTSLPESIGSLTALTTLDIGDCTRLTTHRCKNGLVLSCNIGRSSSQGTSIVSVATRVSAMVRHIATDRRSFAGGQAPTDGNNRPR
jgi:hypothetical protein